MSLSNPNKPVTEQRLQEFYHKIAPYMGGGGGTGGGDYTAGDGILINNDVISADNLQEGDMDDIVDELPTGGRTLVSGFTPVGTVISVMGTTAPTHYLACNGQTVNIADYPELAQYFEEQFGSVNNFGGDGTTTFGIPDLRGEFLRGTGSNGHANQGSGSAVGVHQNATVHIYAVNDSASNNIVYDKITDASVSGPSNADNFLKAPGSAGAKYYPFNVDANNKNVQSAYYSRPTNTSVLYCIATKDIYIDARNIYSTTEKVVGEWIDGKPIYQKTFSEFITLDGSSKEMQYEHNIANIDNVISASGFAKNPTNNRSYAFPQAYSDTYYYFLSANSRLISVERSNVTGWVGLKCTATLQYTKTTD